MRRRKFLKKTTQGVMLAAAHPLMPSFGSSPGRKRKLFILGGTVFVGPPIVEAAISAGFDVTIFNRGISNPALFPDVPLVVGDRTKGIPAYSKLKETQWDFVIDVWPEKSYMVDDASHVLKDSAAHYTFISSIAVYDSYNEPNLREDSKLFEPRKDRSKWQYHEEKVHAERLVKKRFPENHLILRPGPIKGWRDPALDLAYWLFRVKEGGEILAPGTGIDPVQFIDVKDVGAFAIRCIQENIRGTFNTTGPEHPLTWQEFLESCKIYFNSNARLVWVGESFLQEENLSSMSDMPLWAPLTEEPGFMQISNEKASQHDFVYTNIHKTFGEILQWVEREHPDSSLEDTFKGVGIAREREKKLLEKYRRTHPFTEMNTQLP
jgi:2'-hydroxyisoflavone reductase